MEHHQKWTADDEKVAQLIRLKMRKLTKSREIAGRERQDIEQELILHWLRRRARFNAARGSLETFADVVLNNVIHTMLEARRAKKREQRLCDCSLDDLLNEQTNRNLTRGDAYDRDDCFLATVARNRPQWELEDLQLDVRQALRRLPLRQRELARRLMHQSTSEAARSMNITRTTLYTWRKTIRKVFTELGLDEYL